MMKISKKDFEQMKGKYDQEVKKGKAAKGKKGEDKTDQTDWVFFDRETLEKLLSQTDPTSGGIKFYITEYTADTAKKMYPEEADQYEGQLTLVMQPANLEGETLNAVEDGDGNYYNRGRQCPYRCE